MRPRSWDAVLFQVAEGQRGYFTAAQAKAAGLRQVRLAQLAQRRDIVRITRGVYRLARFPRSRFEVLMAATLWPQVRRADVVGVISHCSALWLHGLGDDRDGDGAARWSRGPDAGAASIHLTLPPGMRIRREVPAGLIVHRADLASEEIVRVDGVTATSAARSILDAAQQIGVPHAIAAVAAGRRSGVFGTGEANRVRRQLLRRMSGSEGTD
jgi:predicted transcriptional regulator of viral defense system